MTQRESKTGKSRRGIIESRKEEECVLSVEKPACSCDTTVLTFGKDWPHYTKLTTQTGELGAEVMREVQVV